jgi:4-hydroxy-tetrahydrodipicolinate reductase
MVIDIPAIMPSKRKLRVGLVGFGKTGRAVAATILRDETISLEWVVRRSDLLEHRSVPEFLGEDSDEPGLIYSKDEFDAGELLDRDPVDAIVDFSAEDGMEYYADAAAEREVAIISAISKYPNSKVRELRNLGERTRVLWSPNITLGINFMILAAKTLKKIAPGADIEIIEEHFKAKSEISGTAKKLADALEKDPDEIKSIRAGGIIGVHEVLFGFPYQTVRLRHESISREAFGNGAVFAVHELLKRERGFYSMEEMIGPYFISSNAEYATTEIPRITVLERVRQRLLAMISD